MRSLGIAGALLAAGLAAGLSIEKRQSGGPMVTFLCGDMPDICTNMCYGAYCVGIGDDLRYDKADAATKRARRKTAGCIASGGNRCSTRKGAAPGQQCDEYPFASTEDGGVPDRINKCVPAAQNRRQGGDLNAFYRGQCNGQACSFRVNFGNPGDASNPDYCNAECDTPDDTIENPTNPGNPQDGDEAGDGTDNPDDEEPERKHRRAARQVHRYRTQSGLEITMAEPAQIGELTYWTRPRNATIFSQLVQGGGVDDEDEDDFEDLAEALELVEDVIVEQLE